jgi:trans-aconitate methyltransferase
LLHHDTFYPADSRVLEAGCGVGAQTVILARNNPQARFTSIDASPASMPDPHPPHTVTALLHFVA